MARSISRRAVCVLVDADRDAAPAFIAATAQFTSLCGPRATYLVKDLG